MSRDSALRAHVLELLRGGHAHATLDDAVRGLPAGLRGVVPDGMPHSAWQLIEHLRICQWDIVEYAKDAVNHVSPRWPEGCWPPGVLPPDGAAWAASLAAFRADAAAMAAMVADPDRDLLAPLPNGSGHTLLREALLLADHNAYHVGQIVLVRRRLGAWRG